MRRWRVRAVVAFACMPLLVLSSDAFAGRRGVARDETDNHFTFTYDEESGEMEGVSSLPPIGRDDDVSFLSGLRDRPRAPEGRRLRGSLTLQLVGNKRVVYDGSFSFQVRHAATQQIAYAATRDTRIVLRPRRGQRRARMRFPFEVPSGSYSIVGTFQRN